MNSNLKIIIFFIISLILIHAGCAYAGNFGMGFHGGYGVLKYEESTSALGGDLESESSQNVILFGVSGEYSFPNIRNFYADITTDWAVGLKDDEVWKENGVEIQSNDMRAFAQFYDFRFGYKNSFNDFYYRYYLSGGWDGMHFSRNKFIMQGELASESITEDISLWRMGGGAGFGYKPGQWALDGRIAYAYYSAGKVENSSMPQFRFDTDGTCFDAGIGVARAINKNMSFYFGGSYTFIKLNESEIEQSGLTRAVFPESRTEIITGMANISYSF
ncbi:MAG: hypothetical protein HZC48_02030 [Nitrospirae bacterium]|nr:hypothetical protein [Nitrospirota bacterium]